MSQKQRKVVNKCVNKLDKGVCPRGVLVSHRESNIAIWLAGTYIYYFKLVSIYIIFD